MTSEQKAQWLTAPPDGGVGPRRRAAERLGRLPGVVMLVTIVLCLGTREWYPFTPFPMYATFAPLTWSICVTDDHDRIVPTMPTLAMPARLLRRNFETRVLERVAAGEPRAAAEQHAADDLLRFVLRETAATRGSAPLPARLRLRRVTASVVEQHIERTEESLGEVATQ